MKRQNGWLLCLSLLLLWLAACVPTTSKSEPIVVARPEQPHWPEEVMWVRPDGPAGELMAYNMANGRLAFTLIPGRLAADQQHYFSASTQVETTHVNHFNPANGQMIGNFALGGRWLLAGVSPNGRWLAFTGDNKTAAVDGWQTEIAVVAGEDGRIAHTLQLDGHYEVDALRNDGTGLYLIQYLPPDQPEQYVVRFYDLRLELLQAESVRDKRTTDEVMTGYAWGTVADGRGQWWHTLYVSTQRNKAFIHALNLQDSLFAFCIDLPSGEGDFAALQQYALALSPDGQTIYATNPALGIVAEVSLETFAVARQVAFEAATNPLSSGGPASLLSADGSTLFFSNGHQVWAYDTVTKIVSPPYLAGSIVPVQGLGVSADGSRLAVALAEQPLQLFDVTSGAALPFPVGEVAERP
jgi:hypothetical protein